MDRQFTRVMFSYARLFVASWMFMAGVGLLFGPSPATLQRDAHWRERKLRDIKEDEREQWVDDRDTQDAQSYAYLRLFGVVVGGAGFAMALRETAYLHARYSR